MHIGKVERMLHVWSRMRTRFFTALIAGQFGKIGARSRISPPFRFYGLHRIQLGESVQIERDCWIQTIGTSAEDQSVKLVIGAHSGIGMGASISAVEKVTIGEYVLLARNVYISDHAHAFENPAIPIMQQGLNSINPVSIGRQTWLGQNVIVLPGSIIGDHCVIGANSVVNGVIPDCSVAVGAPARIVKRYNRALEVWEKISTTKQLQ